MNSVGLGSAFTPTVANPNYMPVILDPQQQNGAPEIVYVTAHSGSATTATVLRAQESTSTRAHLTGEFWVAGPTALDLNKGFYAARMIINGSQGYGGSTTTGITMAVDYDSSGSCNTGAGSSRYTAPLNGYYWITARCLLQPSVGNGDVRIDVWNSSGNPFIRGSGGNRGGNTYVYESITSRQYLASGSWIRPVIECLDTSGGTMINDGNFFDLSVSLDELA